MKPLLSHPDLFLHQHIAQMRQAAGAIWARHSCTLRELCAEVWEWIDEGITFHDAGKGGKWFQIYIPDPDLYRGDKMLKAHTPLSFLCVLAHGREHGWGWRRLLALSAIAAGHHSEFKTEDELRNVYGTDAMINILEQQVSTLDWLALDAALGLTLTRIPATEGVELASRAEEQLDLLFEDLRDAADRLPYRLRCQLAFSVLLEADKAFLAIDAKDVARYLNPVPIELSATIVDDFVADKPTAAVNSLRDEARDAFLSSLAALGPGRLQTMTLPTGAGKTLLGATWALTHRERLTEQDSPPPKIIVVLPFLSIVDQTIAEYTELLKSRVSPGDLLSYHSLSERTFDPELDSKSQDFFLDTWQSDVVITTFDQLLLALFSPKTKHQLRFHNLADALLVLDEVQSIPCILWEPVHQALSGLSELGSTHVLAMSATQPGFLPKAHELIPDPGAFFDKMKRYRLVLRHRKPMTLSEFITECRARLPGWKGNRVLLTLNTRRSARQVRDGLAKRAAKAGLHLYFITGDMTPRDRLAAIGEIKKGEPCLVVSTQCVEAGVDIDMGLVIRDFAPFDSLIQIAGRCNRNGNGPRGNVEIVSLEDDVSHCGLASMIYRDKILLQATSAVLDGFETIDEEFVYPLTLRYFETLHKAKNTGAEVVESWINWEATRSVRSLFRGDQVPQYAFLVVDQYPDLPSQLEAALSISDRWQRKRAFRALAPRMALITVSVAVSGQAHLDPAQFADPFPTTSTGDEAWFWLVHQGVYSPDHGLDLNLGSEAEQSWGMMI
jgi:CRISPR-associated endonuclease/helicase Cas3